MISCKQCGTHNSLDSTFCRKCGTEIGEAEIQEGRAKLEMLTSEGTTAFNEGRTDEALAVAESVLLSDPDSIAALWLKAICHERRDEIAQALECADRIVELNPDSELDRIRRNQLRSKLSSQLQVFEKPDRRIALVGAVAACVLVLCVGALAANMARSGSNPERVAQSSGPGNPLLQQQDVPPAGQSSPNPNQGQVGQPTGQDGSAPQVNAVQGTPNQTNSPLRPGDVGAIGQSNEAGPPTTSRIKIPEFGGDTLPEVDGNGSVRPIDPRDLAVRTTNTGNEGAPPVRKNDDEPKPMNPPTTVPEEDPGTIEITVHNGGGSKSTGSDSNGAKSQSLTANAAYELGNYNKAASLFEQAIRSGGDPVGLNQRLGQTYERLGRTGDAVEAYKRAITAGEAALGSGRGNPDRIRSAVESCQQALRKLGA
jgi:tetratricopeptide (TPR) repeat protein